MGNSKTNLIGLTDLSASAAPKNTSGTPQKNVKSRTRYHKNIQTKRRPQLNRVKKPKQSMASQIVDLAKGMI